MKRVAAFGWVAAVFALGLAAGVLGDRLLGRPTEPSPDLGPPPFRRYFANGDLALSADQQRQIEEVFNRQRQKFEAVHRELRPQVEALMDDTLEQVEAILTPEQLERFRSRRHRWQHRSGLRDPGRHGPGRHRRNRAPGPPAEEPR